MATTPPSHAEPDIDEIELSTHAPKKQKTVRFDLGHIVKPGDPIDLPTATVLNPAESVQAAARLAYESAAAAPRHPLLQTNLSEVDFSFPHRQQTERGRREVRKWKFIEPLHKALTWLQTWMGHFFYTLPVKAWSRTRALFTEILG